MVRRLAVRHLLRQVAGGPRLEAIRTSRLHVARCLPHLQSKERQVKTCAIPNGAHKVGQTHAVVAARTAQLDALPPVKERRVCDRVVHHGPVVYPVRYHPVVHELRRVRDHPRRLECFAVQRAPHHNGAAAGIATAGAPAAARDQQGRAVVRVVRQLQDLPAPVRRKAEIAVLDHVDAWRHLVIFVVGLCTICMRVELAQDGPPGLRRPCAVPTELRAVVAPAVRRVRARVSAKEIVHMHHRLPRHARAPLAQLGQPRRCVVSSVPDPVIAEAKGGVVEGVGEELIGDILAVARPVVV